MIITYPRTLPATPGIKNLKGRARNVNAIVESFNLLSVQVQNLEGDCIMFECMMPPMQRVKAAAWVATLVSLRGAWGTFMMGDPDARTPLGNPTSQLPGPQVAGNAQTGRVLLTKNWTVSTSGLLMPGDWIQIGDSPLPRLYMVLNEVESDIYGEAEIDIWPRLRESPPDDQLIVTENTVGTFRLANNDTEWDTDEVSLYGIDFIAREA